MQKVGLLMSSTVGLYALGVLTGDKSVEEPMDKANGDAPCKGR
jgi:hypothetical protein